MLSKSWMKYIVVNEAGAFLDIHGFFVDDVVDIRVLNTEVEADFIADLYDGLVMDVRLTLEEQE